MTTELHLADLILSTVVIIGLLSVSAIVLPKTQIAWHRWFYHRGSDYRP